MVTCHHGNLGLVDYLLHTRANVEFQNADGRTRWGAPFTMHYLSAAITTFRILLFTVTHTYICTKLKGFDM